MRKPIPLIFFLVLAWSLAAFGGNMAFKLRTTLTPTPSYQSLYFVSIPFVSAYGYAENICTDIPGLMWIKRYNSSSDTYTTHTCGNSQDNFAIVGGVSYAVKPSVTVTANLVGAHDDAARLTFTFYPQRANLYWVSIPYHTTATTAQGICLENANFVNIKRYNTSGDTITTHTCGSPLNNFSLVAGTGYGITISASTDWVPSHY